MGGFKGFAHHAGHSAKSARSAHSHHGAGKTPKLFYFSPVTLFGIALGFGATGLLLTDKLPEPKLLIAAIIAGLIFQFLILGQLMNLLLKFASKPSEGLTGSITNFGEAVTKFDHAGRGLVKLTVDGEVVQCLGILDATEHERHVSVLKGDRLMILAVDERNDRCTVSKEFAS